MWCIHVVRLIDDVSFDRAVMCCSPHLPDQLCGALAGVGGAVNNSTSSVILPYSEDIGHHYQCQTQLQARVVSVRRASVRAQHADVDRGGCGGGASGALSIGGVPDRSGAVLRQAGAVPV